MTKSQAEFLPFNAINEFLLTDYRLNLIQEVFSRQKELADERQSAINRLVKRLVNVPGFRNSVPAPAPLKARSAVSAFERNVDFCANVLSAWYELHPDLAARVYEFLTGRGWELLPVETDRAKLPGFLTRWPKSDSFEELDDAFAKAYPDDTTHEYDLNLMITWLWGRLPVDMVETAELDSDEEEDEETAGE